MQLRFKNDFSSPLAVAVMFYDPIGCGSDWRLRGWWNVDPGKTVHTDVWTDNRYFCFYAEAWDGSIWAGPYVGEVDNGAFNRCTDVGIVTSDGRSPYYDVGFRLEDAGSWFWTYASYTISLD